MTSPVGGHWVPNKMGLNHAPPAGWLVVLSGEHGLAYASPLCGR